MMFRSALISTDGEALGPVQFSRGELEPRRRHPAEFRPGLESDRSKSSRSSLDRSGAERIGPATVLPDGFIDLRH